MATQSTENNTTQPRLAEMDIPETLITFTIAFGSVVTLVGALGNTLVILAIAMYRKLRNVHNVFIINLAVASVWILSI